MSLEIVVSHPVTDLDDVAWDMLDRKAAKFVTVSISTRTIAMLGGDAVTAPSVSGRLLQLANAKYEAAEYEPDGSIRISEADLSREIVTSEPATSENDRHV